MKAFGLTGNAGCGKSTVASLFSRYQDVLIIDCDRVAKEILSNQTLQREINSILGTDVFPDGKVNRKLIANIIFKQPEKKRLMEELVHPIVWATVQKMIQETSKGTVCIVESAIIYETKSENLFEAVIDVTCDYEEQVRRLRENRKMEDSDIQALLTSQLSSFEKERRSHFVINTNCTLEQLSERVEKLYRELKQKGTNHENA
ncbi:MAG: dephospho-CoA kinase [Candidatus Paceibacterota bacterium]|jgi:dephospho-CoA kinase